MESLCMMSLPVWLPGPMLFLVDLCPWSHVPSGGICLQGVCLQRAVGHTPGTRKVGSTHPYECFLACLMCCIVVVLEMRGARGISTTVESVRSSEPSHLTTRITRSWPVMRISSSRKVGEGFRLVASLPAATKLWPR